MKKYDLSKIMKRAWELVKNFGMTISEGLKKAWAEAKRSSKEQLVKALEIMGASRWTKYGKDRLYFNSNTFMRRAGISFEYRPNGSKKNSMINGESVGIGEIENVIYGFGQIWLNLDTMELESRPDANEKAYEMIGRMIAET